MSALLGTFLGLLLILIVHFKAERLLGGGHYRKTLLNFIAGIAMAYAFVDVFPHLALKQQKIDLEPYGPIATYLTHHLYLVALIGFCVYVGIRVFSAAEVDRHHSRLAYLLMVASMCIYAAIIGYLLAEQALYRPEPGVLFGIAMAAHFLGLHHELIDTRPREYDLVVRYLLIGCTTLGWMASLLYTISQPVYVIVFAYITGGIVAVGAISDLPRVKTARAFGPFIVGALVFSMLLLAIQWY